MSQIFRYMHAQVASACCTTHYVANALLTYMDQSLTPLALLEMVIFLCYNIPDAESWLTCTAGYH